MPRLYIFAEGPTEQTYGDTVLKQHLAAFAVYVQRPVLIAHAKKRGQVHRGGGRRYLPMKNDILRFLKQENANDVYFTTMIDLYAIHADFPGLDDAEKLRHLPYERVQKLEEHFASDIGDSRFIPYIQLHEFETILLCQPAAFASFFGDCMRQIEQLVAVAGQYKSPELINDGKHTAPSKRIIQIFPDYEGAKAAAGPQIAQEIGLESVRKRCPHFNTWLSKLEALAGKAAI
jgi:hypothetical protein